MKAQLEQVENEKIKLMSQLRDLRVDGKFSMLRVKVIPTRLFNEEQWSANSLQICHVLLCQTTNI